MIELLLVVMALTLITSIVWMTWEAVLPHTQLTTAVRELAAVMQETRSDAVSRGAPYTIEYYFEADENHPRGYRVISPFRAGGGGGLAAGDDQRLALSWNALPPNIEFKRILIDGVEHTRGAARSTSIRAAAPPTTRSCSSRSRTAITTRSRSWP